MYKAMKAYGHNVFIVASVVDQSGKGGSLTYATTANLTEDTEFGKSSPSHEHNFTSSYEAGA
jgi:5'-nucleotidase